VNLIPVNAASVPQARLALHSGRGLPVGESETAGKRSVRVSLTAAQIATTEGAALLSLCHRVTADGEITDPEVEEIRAWVKQNEAAWVGATAFLDKTLAGVLADGKLDPYERHELQTALERILPKKWRDPAIHARCALEAKRYRELTQPAAEVDAPRGEDVLDFMVAGIGYEGRTAVIGDFVHPDACAHLWRDKGNRFSRNAIAVRVGNGLMVGYVPEEHAETMAPLLDQGYSWRAYFKKVLDGHRGPIPIVVAVLTPPRHPPEHQALLRRRDRLPPGVPSDNPRRGDRCRERVR
jgi:hypothetical protein